MSRPMNDCEFIQERENGNERTSTVLTGWETVVFQVEDDPGSDSWTASFAPLNQIFEWVPSQNGFIAEPPQRQSAAFFTSTGLPCASVRVTSPSTRYGPL